MNAPAPLSTRTSPRLMTDPAELSKTSDPAPWWTMSRPRVEPKPGPMAVDQVSVPRLPALLKVMMSPLAEGMEPVLQLAPVSRAPFAAPIQVALAAWAEGESRGRRAEPRPVASSEALVRGLRSVRDEADEFRRGVRFILGGWTGF